MKKATLIFLILIAPMFMTNSQGPANKTNHSFSTPKGVQFFSETVKRLGSSGDNWCITWVKDGDQVTSMCDGNWLKLENYC